MATSRVGNSWISNYFTLRKNTVTCNICNESFPITLKQKEYMMEHIKTVHCDDYQSAVSSEGSQEDWEKFFIRKNNEIKCKFCQILIYFGTDNSCTIRRHLEVKHKVKEDTAEKLCNWLRTHYNFDDKDDAKQRCKYCKNTIPNKIFLLLDHLMGAHKIIAPSKIRPMGLSMKTFSLKPQVWRREYFTTDGNPAKCCICDTAYNMFINYSIIKQHIMSKHNEYYKRDVLTKDQNDIKNWPISKIENNKAKCYICGDTYPAPCYINHSMKNHLDNIHKLDYTKANNLHIWLLYYYHTLDFQTENCKTCDNIFQKYKSSNIMIHFIKTHRINIPLHLRPMGLSKSLQGLLNSNNDANASSGSQQLTCSLDQSSNFDNNLIDLSSKSRPTRHIQDIVTSSKSQQPSCSFDQSFDCYNFFDQVDKSSEIRTTRLSNEISSLFNSDRHTQDIVTSSKSQQSTRSFNCYNFSDHVDKSSKIKAMRHAQDIVTSSKSQQPTRSFDQSSDSDNFFDQIDESSEMKTTRLLSSSSRLLNSDNNAEDASSSY